MGFQFRNPIFTWINMDLVSSSEMVNFAFDYGKQRF